MKAKSSFISKTFRQTGCTARRVLAMTIVSVNLALPGSTVMASSHNLRQSSGRPALTADTPMKQQMLRIEGQMKQLQEQMQTIHSTTDRQQRHKLLLDHIKDMRGVLGRLHNMEIAMATEVERGQVASDTSLKRRQAALGQLMNMMQIMLEQLALQQEPVLYK